MITTMMGVIIVIEYNFGTFDEIDVKIWDSDMVEEGQKNRARPSPPFRAMKEKKTFFFCEVFP